MRVDVEVIDIKRYTLSDALAETIDAQGVPAAIARYQALRDEGFRDAYVSPMQVTGRAYVYLHGEKLDAAKALLRISAELQPDVAVTEAGLGMVQARAGEREEAIEHLRRALAIDPKVPNAAQVLQEMTPR
jgi:tetratricopeptide (TPR) repeat protein